MSESSLTLEHVLRPPKLKCGEISYQQHNPAWDCTFSKDGVWLAVCSGPYVRLWKQSEGSWVLEHTLHDEEIHSRTIRSLSWAPLPTGRYVLAAASFDGTVSIWEWELPSKSWSCTTQLEGHESEVKCVTWNQSGSLLATCGRDKTVWIWETWLEGTIGDTGDEGGDWECLAILSGHEGDVKCAKFTASHNAFGSGDEILISTGYDDTIRIWAEDGEDWYCAMALGGNDSSKVHTDTIWSLSIASGGGRLVSASADGSLGILKFYSPSERKQNQFEDDDDQAPSSGLWRCVGKLPDAHSASIPGAFDGSEEHNDRGSAVACAMLPPCTVYAVDCAPARTGHGRIASGGSDGEVHVYKEVMTPTSSSDAPQFALDASSASTPGGGDVHSVCWHPYDGSILASASNDGALRIWNYKS